MTYLIVFIAGLVVGGGGIAIYEAIRSAPFEKEEC